VFKYCQLQYCDSSSDILWSGGVFLPLNIINNSTKLMHENMGTVAKVDSYLLLKVLYKWSSTDGLGVASLVTIRCGGPNKRNAAVLSHRSS